MSNVKNLFAAEIRLASVERYSPQSSEVTRLKNVVESIRSNLSESEMIQYEEKKNFKETTEQLAARFKREIAEMEANRDSQSI